MRRLGLTILLLETWLCAGCQTDTLAKNLIEPANISAGKFALAMKGSNEQLLKQGRIDASRQVTMPDKAVIDVWVLRAGHGEKTPPQARGTVVLLHGLTESKGSYPYLGVGERLARMGYDVVLPDLRWHGRSSGKYVTYGAKEKHDIKAVMDDLAKENLIALPIYAFGVNLGGAVAIQYAAIDERCKGVMAVAPYKDFASIARRGLLLLSDKDFQAVIERAGKMGEFDPAEASAVQAAKELKCPLLVVHGFWDLSVPLEHGEAIVAAAPEPKKLSVPVLDFGRMVLEDWIADQVDKMAKTGLKDASSPSAAPAIPTSRPAAGG